MNMQATQIVNTLGLHTSNFINGQKGSYRIIYKCQAGFLSIAETKYNDDIANDHGPAQLLSSWKKGSLQTIQFMAEGTQHWLNVFARKGKKIVVIDEEILKGLTVGTINSYWIDTNLYSQKQYAYVNAKNWACKAFVMNAA
jgi:hypothetical protein